MSFLPSIVPRMKAYVLSNELVSNSPKVSAFLGHPAGPFTIHFWAPAMKWGISIANFADMRKSPEFISTPQQCAVALTGLIWSRYSLVIVPVNYNLFSVNLFMAASGLVQLYRKVTWEQSLEDKTAIEVKKL